jgi:hypothetical protein
MARKTKAQVLDSKGVPEVNQTTSVVETLDLLRVMTIRETAGRAGMSVDTLRRRINDGTGPRCVELSIRRRGVVVRDYVEWLGIHNNSVA